MKRIGAVCRNPLTVMAIALALASGMPALATTAAAGASGGKSTIVVGDIGEDSGPIGASIASSKVAAEAWEAYTNAHGGLNGHPVKIIFGDDATSTSTALSLATTMVTQDHVVAMFGLHAQDPEGSLLKFFAKDKIPIIGVGNSGNELTAESSAMYTTMAVAKSENDDQVAILKRIAPKNTKVGVIYCQGVTACTSEVATVKAYAPKVGLDVVYTASAPLVAPTYTAQVIAAKSAGAQELISIEDPPATSSIIKNAAQQNWYPYVEGAPVQYSSTDTLKTLPSQAKLVVDSVTLPWSLSKRMKPYVQAVQKYEPGGALGEDGGGVWVAGALFKYISSKFGSTVTSSDITKDLLSLRKVTLGGLVPPLTYPKGSTRTQVDTCIGAVEYVNGAWTAPLGATTFVCTSKAQQKATKKYATK